MENRFYILNGKKLSDISSINEIEEFAYKIKYLGDKYNYPPLEKFSEKLTGKSFAI
jgi:hypothetical protein